MYLELHTLQQVVTWCRTYQASTDIFLSTCMLESLFPLWTVYYSANGYWDDIGCVNEKRYLEGYALGASHTFKRLLISIWSIPNGYNSGQMRASLSLSIFDSHLFIHQTRQSELRYYPCHNSPVFPVSNKSFGFRREQPSSLNWRSSNRTIHYLLLWFCKLSRKVLYSYTYLLRTHKSWESKISMLASYGRSFCRTIENLDIYLAYTEFIVFFVSTPLYLTFSISLDNATSFHQKWKVCFTMMWRLCSRLSGIVGCT